METIEKVVTDLEHLILHLKVLLIDGILYAFPEQTSDDANVMFNGFGALVNAQPKGLTYLPQLCVTIKWRSNNKSAKVR